LLYIPEKMNVNTIYISTYRLDFQFAKFCIASIRYWYPNIRIELIKDFGAGDFDTTVIEKVWNVSIFQSERKRFGWGYGKLEPLFEKDSHSFLVIDADTVLTGPVLDNLDHVKADFIVDEEVHGTKRFNEIYYHLEKIRSIEPEFEYPGYSFNSGQWIGTSGVLKRDDFAPYLEWSEPPKVKFSNVFFNGDQGLLNFVMHFTQQKRGVIIQRRKLMVWPAEGKAEFIKLECIKKRESVYPYVLHWAGMKFGKWHELPRADILEFYMDYYYKRMGVWEKFKDTFSIAIMPYRKKLMEYTAKLK